MLGFDPSQQMQPKCNDITMWNPGYSIKEVVVIGYGTRKKKLIILLQLFL
jgi:hypothetical protein